MVLDPTLLEYLRNSLEVITQGLLWHILEILVHERILCETLQDGIDEQSVLFGLKHIESLLPFLQLLLHHVFVKVWKHSRWRHHSLATQLRYLCLLYEHDVVEATAKHLLFR